MKIRGQDKPNHTLHYRFRMTQVIDDREYAKRTLDVTANNAGVLRYSLTGGHGPGGHPHALGNMGSAVPAALPVSVDDWGSHNALIDSIESALRQQGKTWTTEAVVLSEAVRTKE